MSVCLLLLTLTIKLCSCAYWTQGENAILSVDLNDINSYTISINNKIWLTGGEPNLYCNNHWYYESTTMEYKLTPKTTSPVQTKGTDANLGDYVGLEMIYTLTSNDNICNGKTFTTSFEYFSTDDFFQFTQAYPDGLTNTNIKQFMNPPVNGIYTPMVPLSEFPAFSYSETSMLRSSLGYIEWQGRFMHDRSSHGIGLHAFEGGNEGGPIILFKDGVKPPLAPSLVFSSASNFMNGIFAIRTRRGNGNNKNCTLYNNIDMEGNDQQIFTNIKSADDCCSLCETNEFCDVFSYIPAGDPTYGQHCYLKYNDRGKTNNNGHISGTVGSNSDNGNLDYLVAGVEGNLTMLPKQYSISYIISATDSNGIHGAAYKWGHILQKKYGTTKLDASIDLVVSTLGYWTDNGGYYYGGKTLTTDIATKLFDSFRENNIPVRYLQLDPYWYMGQGGPIIWEANPRLFPNGLTDLYNKINKVPLLLYTSYWTPDGTVNYYNSKYNLSLTFANSEEFNAGFLKGQISEPLGYESSYNFYKFIISQYSDIMYGFEVDFMDFEYENFIQQTNGYNGYVNQSQEWTKGMQDACMEFKFSVQYCMSLPAYILTALQYPAVTNARASEDDFPGNHNRWQIAYTSLLLSPLKIRPFFDVLWTTSVQPGNAYGVNTMDCEMQVIVATLSYGPVGIGDDINMTNKTIIDRFVRADGILLHPSRSATPIDAMYSSSSKPSGEIWMTYSAINDNGVPDTYNILTVDVVEEYKLTFADLFPMPNNNDVFMVYTFDDGNDNPAGQCKNNTNVQQCGIAVFNNTQYLSVITSPPPKNNNQHLHSWHLYNAVRKQTNGWVLLGEMNRYVNLSPQRFKSIQITNNPNGMKIVVSGGPNEKIIVSFITNSMNILQVSVTFNNNGDDQTVTVY